MSEAKRQQFNMIIDPITVVDPSYNLAAGAATLGLAAGVLENFKGATGKLFGGLAIVFTLIGGFFAYQTATLRFTFDENNFALTSSLDGGKIGKNEIVGGENKWTYKSFLNYDFLPSEEFPILGVHLLQRICFRSCLVLSCLFFSFIFARIFSFHLISFHFIFLIEFHFIVHY